MRKLSKRTLVLALVIVLLTAASAGALYWKNKEDEPTQTADTTSKDSEAQADIPGPTDEEKQAGDAKKEEIIREQEQTNPPSGQKAVTPVVSNANQTGQEIMISGFVPGIVEGSGACTYTISKGSNQITKTVNAFADASTTNCQVLTINRVEFAEPGDWGVVIAYNSGTSKGQSGVKTLKVQ